nr:DUF255 domain-containing protein [Paenibacillus sp. FSL H7-0357]
MLKQAHNPVDWFPWSEEAFDKVKIALVRKNSR